MVTFELLPQHFLKLPALMASGEVDAFMAVSTCSPRTSPTPYLNVSPTFYSHVFLTHYLHVSLTH
jgi:hypothetical protein